MIIDCISDLHGHFPDLDEGDLLIVAGDLTSHNFPYQYYDFYNWLMEQRYEKIIVIGGNHDVALEKQLIKFDKFAGIEYLCDSGTQFKGLKIWGSPWTLKFPGMNPACMAFTCDTEEELAEKWDLIPDDIDILVTHSPPYGIFDETRDKKLVGSMSLLSKLAQIKPLIHCFGHIHEKGGKDMWFPWKRGTTIVNCSHVNEYYQPVNKPVRIVL